MRDLLSYDPAEGLPEPEPDPVRRTRDLGRKALPKRFYGAVTTDVVDGGFRILLDGRPLRTPAKQPFIVPRADLAAVIAAEWQAQETHVDPATMPSTRLANSVIDGVAGRMAEVAADALKYAGSDLLCYRATGPARLVDRQTALWDPLLDWIDERFGARFLVAEGVIPIEQDPEAIAALGRIVAGFDAWRLAGLHALTTLTGSLVVALAHVLGRLDADTAWAVAHVDEDWNAELWGVDAEAAARLERRRHDFAVASLFARDPPPAAAP